MGYQSASFSAAQASASDRSAFIIKTYLHLFGAIAAFVGLEAVLFMSGLADVIAPVIFGWGNLGWLLVLGGFMAVSWMADRWARSSTSLALQYTGLGLYVAAESVIFLPLLWKAHGQFGVGLIFEAAVITMVLFGGLTGVVFITRKDFSFMRGILMFGGFAAIGLIVASALFGFSLGIFFSWAMLFLAGGYILYNTSNVLHHYRTDQHVSAALTLFAAVALMFWYVLRILMSRD